MVFYNSFGNGNSGFYDAGAGTLESISEAGESGYATQPKACEVGHVYVVKTLSGYYAKFVVRSVENVHVIVK